MLVVSSREFRQNQKIYFEKVDEGEQIIVQRGKDKSYIVRAVSENDMYFNEEMLERIKLSMQQAKDGKVKRVSTDKEVKDLLGL